ncbi:MAG: transposase [Cyanobacteria bacterium P01_A01_bin.37]
MRPTPSPLSPATPGLTDEATLSAALDCLLEHIPLDMQGDCTPETVYEILLHASSRQDSIEHTTQILEDVPTGNDIRYHLDKLEDISTLEAQLNAALGSRLPAGMGKRKQRIAIDLNLLPYYGQPTEAEAPYIYRSKAKAGTTRFFAYATAYVIRAHQRVTLALHAVPCYETLVATLTYLLAQLTALQIRLDRLYLDRGFYSVPIIRWLQALDIPFLMPAIIRGKTGGTRQLLKGRTSYQTEYTLKSPTYGQVSCQIRVICTYQKGRRGHHGVQYFLYVVHRIKVALRATHQHYRTRFGIETSYRLKNLCRIRTTTKNPTLRLLFVGISFVLVNLWVYLLWTCISLRRQGGRLVCRHLFTLKTMLEFLAHAVERQFPIITAIILPDGI